MRATDRVTFSIMHNALLNAATEMKVMVMRTGRSPLWREAGDLSCAVLDRHGDVVAQGADDLPVHMASMPFSARGALDRFPIDSLEPGDVLFHNHPAYGNNHLPDCIMMMPIFVDGVMLGFSAVRGHWTDIGGNTPGSYTATNTELIQEGLCIPPIKLMKLGVMDDELLSLILHNVRNPELRRADVNSQYAGCLRGAEKLREIAVRYGTDLLLECMSDVLDYSEELTRDEIALIPDGEYTFTEYSDGVGFDTELTKIFVTVRVEGSGITIDFAGSDSQATGGINAPLAVTASAALFAIKCLTDPWNPANSGSYRPVTVTAPEGTVVNPRPDAPVVAANHETASLIAAAIMGALAEVRRERTLAAGSSSAGVVAIGGRREDGSSFVFHEPSAGSWGARSTKDGINALRDGPGNTGIHSAEIVETEYPIRILAHELVVDGGGAGRHRGGLPPRRVYEVTTDATVTIVTERQRNPAFGLEGGAPGGAASFRLKRPGEAFEPLVSKTPGMDVPAGTVISAQGGGGGGFGDPRERSRDDLAADVRDGYVSADSAETDYAGP